MNASFTYKAMRDDEERYQLFISAFVDAFRRAPRELQPAMVEADPEGTGPLYALLAAVVSALCHEANLTKPSWILPVRSAEPFFVLPANGVEMRLRLMLESPPPFRNRNVFVPENYMSRA